MNYLEPRQRESDKRWDYTSRNDNRVHPLGYCAGTFDKVWPEWDESRVAWPSREHYEADRARASEHRDKYHGDGHATAEEACACYRDFMLDQRLHLDGRMQDQQLRCRECGTFTDRAARIGSHELIPLCDEHRTREVVERHYEVGAAITS